MELQTRIDLGRPEFRVDYNTRIALLGSCFVENIGEKLRYFRFKADVNPCGIVYNPVSVANSLKMVMENRRLDEADLLSNNGQWVSLSHHGSFSSPESNICLQKINERLENSHRHLQETDLLVITWGTSWIYRYRPTGQIVSNCHKFPASDFDRYRLEIADIENLYTGLLSQLQEFRPGMRILFTVSPIRHWKDGAHGNQLSKAVLMLALDKLMRRFGNVSYFPSYEIVMDELRDYRFYAEDMLHISSGGVDYIWEKFRDLYFTEEARELMKRVDKINKILLHRPTTPDSEASVQLREKALLELKSLGFQIS